MTAVAVEVAVIVVVLAAAPLGSEYVVVALS